MWTSVTVREKLEIGGFSLTISSFSLTDLYKRLNVICENAHELLKKWLRLGLNTA